MEPMSAPAGRVAPWRRLVRPEGHRMPRDLVARLDAGHPLVVCGRASAPGSAGVRQAVSNLFRSVDLLERQTGVGLRGVLPRQNDLVSHLGALKPGRASDVTKALSVGEESSSRQGRRTEASR